MKRFYRNRLIEISAIILIAVVFIQIIVNFIYLYSEINNLHYMRKANEFSRYISEVLHRTQQERGAGAGYLGNSSKEFKKLYIRKIKLTDKSINKLLEASKYCKKVSIENVKAYFDKLDIVRQKVLNNQISFKKEIVFYSKMNESLLGSMGKILKIPNDIKVVQNFASYRNFEMAKEKVGIERAVLSGVFSQDRWSKNLYILYVNLLAEQKLLFKLSMELTNNKIKNKFYSLEKSNVFKKVLKVEKIARNKEKNFGINALKFYNLITTKINMLNEVVLEMIKLNNATIYKLKSSLLKKFIYQLFINILLVVFLFYTLFLFYKEQKILRSKSIKDKLTRLYNRDYLFEVFSQMKARSDRNKTKLALFFLDLDGFKQINDTYGHKAGDEVLIETAKRLKKIFRKSDIIVRLGGDEFVVLVENTTYENCKIIANKVIKEITKEINIDNKISVKVGTSIGIAIYPNNAYNIEELIKKADEAMYFSKRRGKGIYTFYN
jgi:diguanylate cyclase (GGDEF)-like protein